LGHFIPNAKFSAALFFLSFALGCTKFKSAQAYVYGVLLPVSFIDALQHSNIDFPGAKLSWLSDIFILPNFHALHHSKNDDRVNFGLFFSFWDRLFGTFKMPVVRPISFGVADPEWENKGLLWQHMAPLAQFQSLILRRSEDQGNSSIIGQGTSHGI